MRKRRLALATTCRATARRPHRRGAPRPRHPPVRRLRQCRSRRRRMPRFQTECRARTRCCAPRSPRAPVGSGRPSREQRTGSVARSIVDCHQLEASGPPARTPRRVRNRVPDVVLLVIARHDEGEVWSAGRVRGGLPGHAPFRLRARGGRLVRPVAAMRRLPALRHRRSSGERSVGTSSQSYAGTRPWLTAASSRWKARVARIPFSMLVPGRQPVSATRRSMVTSS